MHGQARKLERGGPGDGRLRGPTIVERVAFGRLASHETPTTTMMTAGTGLRTEGEDARGSERTLRSDCQSAHR